MKELITTPVFIEAVICLAYLAGGVLALLVAKGLMSLIAPYKLDYELTQNDNPALGLAMAGYYLGVAIVFAGAILDPTTAHREMVLLSQLQALGYDLLYVLAAIVAMLFGALLVDKVMLPRFDATREIITDRNMGMGWVQFGSYLATALSVAGAINGNWGGIWSTLMFVLLGQLVIMLFGFLYMRFAGYNVAKEIEDDNVAAGGSLGMALIAIGIIVCKVSAAPYSGFGQALLWFAIDILIAMFALLGLRWFTDLVFLPDATFEEEVARDRNINAPLIEGSLAVALAVIISFAL